MIRKTYFSCYNPWRLWGILLKLKRVWAVGNNWGAVITYFSGNASHTTVMSWWLCQAVSRLPQMLRPCCRNRTAVVDKLLFISSCRLYQPTCCSTSLFSSQTYSCHWVSERLNGEPSEAHPQVCLLFSAAFDQILEAFSFLCLLTRKS